MLWYIFSWFVNFLMLAVVLGIVAVLFRTRIEDHQTLGAFMIFVLPTALELLSIGLNNKPFLMNLVGP